MLHAGKSCHAAKAQKCREKRKTYSSPSEFSLRPQNIVLVRDGAQSSSCLYLVSGNMRLMPRTDTRYSIGSIRDSAGSIATKNRVCVTRAAAADVAPSGTSSQFPSPFSCILARHRTRVVVCKGIGNKSNRAQRPESAVARAAVMQATDKSRDCAHTSAQ